MGFFGTTIVVNFVLLAIPIGVTLGILFGLDAQRSATGQAPIYSPPASSGGDGGDGGGLHDNKLTTKMYCQKSFGITPDTKGQEFTLNPNQWGWDPSEGGGLCMNVTTYDNSTYPTKNTAPAWSITWSYPQGPESQPVHAFPNVLVDGGVFPATVQSLAQIDLDVQWTYGLGNSSAATTDETALTTEKLNANVAVDMFLDSDKASSGNSTRATYEVMVWLADFGDAAQPIGKADGVVATAVLNQTAFSLYYGQNSLAQNVLTWVATETTEKFRGDLLPLFTKLFALGASSVGVGKYPTETDYLGYFAFGSEAYYSDKFVTLSVPALSVNVSTTA